MPTTKGIVDRTYLAADARSILDAHYGDLHGSRPKLKRRAF